jgi:hypothetical protein
MKTYLLKTADMSDIPESIKIIDSYGKETIIYDRNKIVEGYAYLLEGEVESFQSWLSNVKGVWVSSNPMAGWEWEENKDNNG